MDAVMVSVLRDGVMIDYALTDGQGKYSLPWKHSGTLQLKASMLGYRQEIRNISSSGQQNFSLQPEAIALKEVQIRGGRVYGRKDTVRYDLSQFASDKDVHIKDVLKRLPGVDVEESGQVKYKGKAIDHFLVEGMDLTGGRYNQVNNSLNAKAVKTAEIMENYQSVKALKGKINSDEVALNLKLDPKARDQWIMNGTLGTGWSDAVKGKDTAGGKTGILWKGSASALQLGRGKQNLYNYKTNNNGTDLSNEQALLTNREENGISQSAFLSQPGVSAPLDKHRLLFNNTHILNGNRMYKWNDERSLRLQAGYTHDRISQERRNTLSYYQPSDTIRVDETYHYRLQSDNAYAEMHYEDNNRKHYLSNRFRVEGLTGQSTSQGLRQKIQTSELKAGNIFHLLRNKEADTWEINSKVQYALLPSTLQVTDETDKYRQQRKLPAQAQRPYPTISCRHARRMGHTLATVRLPVRCLQPFHLHGSLLPIRARQMDGQPQASLPGKTILQPERELLPLLSFFLPALPSEPSLEAYPFRRSEPFCRRWNRPLSPDLPNGLPDMERQQQTDSRQP